MTKIVSILWLLCKACQGFAGADERYRLGVSVVTEEAWHCLFASTLFIRSNAEEAASFDPDWRILNACNLKIDDFEALGLNSEACVIQSLEQKKVLIFGTRYAGEIKKSIFYAMNYDMPDVDVFPMHCSSNVAEDDDTNVALFFGLSGTGKTTLSADPDRPLIGDDEHGWSDAGVFLFSVHRLVLHKRSWWKRFVGRVSFQLGFLLSRLRV